MLSGVTKIILTKADVLDGFKQIETGIAYSINGEETMEFPFDICNANITPIYKTFSGWDESISTCTSFENLPTSFKEYCNFVESYLGTKIAFISNGTGRDQLLVTPS
jgi:adenylosuccinate synthase